MDPRDVDGEVLALANPLGTVWVGGRFKRAGTAAVKNLARFDTKTGAWSNPGDVNGMVLALLENRGTLYVGGAFDQVGGVAAKNVARWDGKAWSALGSGCRGEVRALALYKDTLYAGCDGTLAKWDGKAWATVDGVDGSNALVTGKDGVYVATHKGVVKFDGAKVSPVGGELENTASALLFGPRGELYAGGSSVFQKWDGKQWTPFGPPEMANKAIKAMALQTNLILWVGGAFEKPHRYLMGLQIPRGTWIHGPGRLDQGVEALLVNDAGELVIGGKFAGGVLHEGNKLSPDGNGLLGEGLVVRMNGGHATVGTTTGVYGWTDEGWGALGEISGGNGRVNALAFDGTAAMYAAGSFDHIGGVAAKNVARWRGDHWEPLGDGLDGEVSTLVALDGTVWAGGSFETVPGVKGYTGVAKFDGKGWVGGGAGAPRSVQQLVVRGGKELYACGHTETKAGSVAKYDGTKWTGVGGGIDGPVNGIFVAPSGNVYAVGLFEHAGGVKAHNLARFSGGKWAAVSSDELDGEAFAITTSKDEVYVAGDFRHAGKLEVNRVAKWDGKKWSAVGGGVDRQVRDMAVADDGLWLVGEFEHAGGKPSLHVARWTP